MLPLLPPDTILDLGRAFASEPIGKNTRTAQHPDGFLMEESLQPDPLFMALRHLWTSNPLAWLVNRLRKASDGDFAGNLATLHTGLLDERSRPDHRYPRESEAHERDIAA